MPPDGDEGHRGCERRRGRRKRRRVELVHELKPVSPVRCSRTSFRQILVQVFVWISRLLQFLVFRVSATNQVSLPDLVCGL